MGSDTKAWEKLLNSQDAQAAGLLVKREGKTMGEAALESVRQRSKRVAKELGGKAGALLDAQADAAHDWETTAALAGTTDMVCAGVSNEANDGPNARAEARRMRPLTDAPSVGATIARRLTDAGIDDAGALAFMAIHKPDELAAFRGLSSASVTKIAEWAQEEIPIEDVNLKEEEKKEESQREVCLQCDGSTHVECPDCLSSGDIRVPGGIETCPSCSGHGEIDCHVCDGQGWLLSAPSEEEQNRPHVDDMQLGDRHEIVDENGDTILILGVPSDPDANPLKSDDNSGLLEHGDELPPPSPHEDAVKVDELKKEKSPVTNMKEELIALQTKDERAQKAVRGHQQMNLVSQIWSASDWECPSCGESYGGPPNPTALTAMDAVTCPSCGSICAQRLVLENQRLKAQLELKQGLPMHPTSNAALCAIATEILGVEATALCTSMEQLAHKLHAHGFRKGAATASEKAAAHIQKANANLKTLHAQATTAQLAAKKALAMAPGLVASRFTLIIGGTVIKGVSSAMYLQSLIDEARATDQAGKKSQNLHELLDEAPDLIEVAAKTIELVRKRCGGHILIANPDDPTQALALRVLRGEAAFVIEWRQQ